MNIPFQDIIRLRKNEAVPSIYDVSAQGFDRLSVYRQVELHTVLYPYSRQVSSQDIAFYPFEEYVRDVRPCPPEEPVVRFETPPGRQAQVDFADFRLPWGKRYALLVVLGYSRLLWVQFYTRKTMRDPDQ